MARHRVVCTEQEPVSKPTTHAHIVAVGTGTDASKATKRWTRKEVLDAMDGEDTFYTKSVSTGKVAEIVEYKCRRCKKRHIRSSADAVADINLDSLRRCEWK